MEKSISIIRIAILIALGILGMLFLFGEEQDNTAGLFILHCIADKLFGALCLYLLYRLERRWSKTDKWLIAYHKWNNKVMEGE